MPWGKYESNNVYINAIRIRYFLFSLSLYQMADENWFMFAKAHLHLLLLRINYPWEIYAIIVNATERRPKTLYYIL